MIIEIVLTFRSENHVLDCSTVDMIFEICSGTTVAKGHIISYNVCLGVR